MVKFQKDTPIRAVRTPEPRALTDLGDDDLMLLAAAGRQDAFELLMRRYQALVYGLASRYLGDEGTGRDVAQDVFLALWAKRTQYRPQGRFRSYIVSVTLNRCSMMARGSRNHNRKMSSLEREVEARPPVSDLPLDKLVEQEKARRVRSLLTQLPEKHRRVLILRFTHELAFEEISEMTQTPIGTVKSHAFRGLRKLHALLSKESPR